MGFGLLHHDWSNAMLVAGSIYQAYRYYKFFTQDSSNTLLRGHVAVVTSYDPMDSDIANDSADTSKETEAKFKYDWAKQSYKDADDGINNADDYEKVEIS